MNCVTLFGLLFELAAIIFALSLLKKSRWNLFVESIHWFPENVRRLARWRWRRILRAWYCLYTVYLQCRLACIKK